MAEVRRQCLDVGQQQEQVMTILERNSVLETADEMAHMQSTRRAIACQHTFPAWHMFPAWHTFPARRTFPAWHTFHTLHADVNPFCFALRSPAFQPPTILHSHHPLNANKPPSL